MNKAVLYFCFIAFSFTLLFCKKNDPDPRGVIEKESSIVDVPPVDSSKLVEALTVWGRYWILEKITIKTKDQERDVSEDTSFFSKKELFELYNGAFHFSPYATYPTIKKYYQYEPSMSAGWSYYANGLYGNRPYGISELYVYISFPDPKAVGFWKWARKEEKLSISPLTRYRFLDIPDSSSSVYIDPLSLPRYTTLQQAMAGGKPEKIKIIAETFNKELGEHKYIYTLRAAWVVERKYKQDRWHAQYIVLY